MTSAERDQVACDLVLVARSVSDDAERCAWRLLSSRPMPSGPEIRRVIRTVAAQLAGMPTEQAVMQGGAWSYDPVGTLDATSELVRAVALHMLAGGGSRGAVLPEPDRAAVRALLRGKRPLTPPALLSEAQS